MSLLAPLRELAEKREALLGTLPADPFALSVDDVTSATRATVLGRSVVMAGTNNYLGLTFDPDCIAAGRIALEGQGTGMTGSRMANGSSGQHLELEAELRAYFDAESAIVFTTGYQANLGVISALLGSGSVALIDADCHASIYDGCRLSGAEVYRFRHNSPEDLERKLVKLSDEADRTLVIVEGLYSMRGDRAPLEEIVAMKRRFGVELLVDEAHSFGVLGESGRGLAEDAGVERDVDFITGTFSKSIGTVGGFCVSRHPLADLLRYKSRPYIFTAASPPSVIASTRAALRIIGERPELRARLWAGARRVYARLESLGYRLGPDVGPIIAADADSPAHAVSLWAGLLERGVYVNLMLPPATPRGESLLRCSITAAHSDEDLDRICGAFEEVADRR